VPIYLTPYIIDVEPKLLLILSVLCLACVQSSSLIIFLVISKIFNSTFIIKFGDYSGVGHFVSF